MSDTPPDASPPLTERAIALACGAIDHAAFHLAEDGQFLATAIGEGTHAELMHPLLRPAGAHPPERGAFFVLSGDGPEHVRAHIAARLDGLEAYAIVWDGYVREAEDAPPRDAILVEVAVRGEPCGHIVMAGYRPKDADEPFTFTGETAELGTAPSLFADDDRAGG